METLTANQQISKKLSSNGHVKLSAKDVNLYFGKKHVLKNCDVSLNVIRLRL